MPLTPADRQQIDSYINNGTPHLARVMLEAHLKDEPFDELARKVLGKINKRFPPTTPTPAFSAPTTPPPTKSIAKPAPIARPKTDLPPALRLDSDENDIEAIKQAIREKRYDDAEALLVLSDHPDADKLRERLSAIRGSSATVKEKAKSAPRPLTLTPRRATILILTVVVGIMVAGWYSNFQRQQEELNRKIRIKFALNDVCFEVFWEEYFDQLGASAFNDACDEEIDSMLTFYGPTVDRCYNTWGQETNKMIECLADGGAKFPTVYMLTGDS